MRPKRSLLTAGRKPRLRGGVAQGIDDTVDDRLDQQAILAFAHDPDHRLGARGADDEAAVTVEALFRLPGSRNEPWRSPAACRSGSARS